MNYHSDEWILDKLKEHYEEAKTIIPENQIVGIFLQGSQNYGLDFEESDIDSKLIVVPSLEDLVYNRAPLSYTHVRENDEHIDVKDIRLYMDCFKKQNINFVEILFTKYKIVNESFKDLWRVLIDNRELIAHLSIYRTVKCITGTTMMKYKALEHPYPSKLEVLSKYGYDPKQLHHMFRLKEFLHRYLTGVPYEECLQSLNCDFLKEIKKGKYGHTEAKVIADIILELVDKEGDDYCNNNEPDSNQEALDILSKTQYNIMYKSIKENIQKEDN